MNTVIIETHEENGVEWGISFTDSNPDPKDYFKMTDEKTAFRLKGYLSRLLERQTIEQIIQGRLEVAKQYCEKMGWPTDPAALSFEQILEIRELPEWINATAMPPQTT